MNKNTILTPRYGFELFFPGAVIFSIISILFWTLIYTSGYSLSLNRISVIDWHAHEMVYGYVAAVISGYMLYNVKKSFSTLTEKDYFVPALFAIWLIPRIIFFTGDKYLFFAAVLDLLFITFLSLYITYLCIKNKQARQMSVLSKLFLILAGNTLFYLGIFKVIEKGIYWGLYGGVYISVSLILTVGRKLLPQYINELLPESEQVFSPRWLDITNLFLFLFLFISDLFLSFPYISATLCFLLASLNLYRLKRWYNPVIWKNPVIWSIFLSFIFISLGFLLMGYAFFSGYPRSAGIHGLTYGGIGFVTLGMMARVIFDNINISREKVKSWLTVSFTLLLIGAVIRVILPAFEMQYYFYYIAASQLLWLAAFLVYITGIAFGYKFKKG